MVTFFKISERFKNIDVFLLNIASKSIMKFNKDVVGLNNEQLLKGLNINGEVMQNGYSKKYGMLRKRKGLQTSFVDLKFSGKYQKSKKLIKYDYGIDIRSSADYEAHLRANYPEHVGLNEENAEIIAEKLKPLIEKELNKYLFK